MATKKQVDAVIDAVTVVLGNDFIPGNTKVKEVLTAEQKDSVVDILVKGIVDGEITYRKDASDKKALRRYVNGMIGNHFNRNPVLNGNNGEMNIEHDSSPLCIDTSVLPPALQESSLS